ncbi:MAG: helix-turn-helix transcriptional regulator [Acetatifactor sp.]|nr:helix-turn-helix transcriptional regulator [Acetatifactor sp.]
MDAYLIGCFLSELRKQKGMKQKEVAEAIQVSDKAVSRWETGRGIPDIDSLQRLSDFYEISINEILAGRYLNADEVKESSDNNLRRMGKEASNFKKKLLAAIAVNIVLLVLLVVVFLFGKPKSGVGVRPFGLAAERRYEYSESDMNIFFRDIARLENAGTEYDIDFDTNHKIIVISIVEYQYTGTIEEFENLTLEDIKIPHPDLK